jgi:hypothetical protein
MKTTCVMQAASSPRLGPETCGLSALWTKALAHPETVVTPQKRRIPQAGNCAFCADPITS